MAEVLWAWAAVADVDVEALYGSESALSTQLEREWLRNVLTQDPCVMHVKLLFSRSRTSAIACREASQKTSLGVSSSILAKSLFPFSRLGSSSSGVSIDSSMDKFEVSISVIG